MTYNFATLKVNFKNELIPLWLITAFKEDLTELYNNVEDCFNPQPIKVFYYKKMNVKIKPQSLVIKLQYLNKITTRHMHKIESYVADTINSWLNCGLKNSECEFINYNLTFKGEK